MLLTDLLSRNFLPESGGGQDFQTSNMISFLLVRSTTLENIHRAIETDETMALLMKTIISRWPETKAKLPNQIVPYFASRDKYSVQDELVFK